MRLNSSWVAGVVALSASVLAGGAYADVINFGPQTSSGTGTADPITVSLKIAPPFVGTAKLFVSVIGDLGAPGETLEVVLGGKRVTIPGGSLNGGGVGDENGCGTPHTADIEITNDELTEAASAGSLDIVFNPSNPVGNACTDSASNTFFAFTVTEGSLTFTPGTPPDTGDPTNPPTDDGVVNNGDDSTTSEAAQSVAATRGGLTVANLPGLSGRMGGGGGGGDSTSSLSGGGDLQAGSLSFSTSLAALRQAASSDDVSQGGTALGFHAHPGVGAVDIWVGGSYTYFESDIAGVTSQGDVGTAQIGLDMRVSERLLVGILAMGDLLKSDLVGGTQADGFGFLAGPYAVATLTDNIFLEGLAAAGMSFNEIDAAGAASIAEYDTQRLLLTARISGSWDVDNWTISPSARLTYYADKQEAFTDGNGAPAPENTTLLGQVRFGPEIAYRWTFDEDSSIRPYAGVEGVYSFLQSDQVINGVLVTQDELSATATAGFDLNLGPAAIRAGARYDGVGTDQLDAITGELQVRLPLN